MDSQHSLDAQTAKAPQSISVEERISTLFTTYLGCHFDSGNSVDVLRNGREIFPAMLEAIEKAEDSVDFLTFVYWDGDIAQKFCDALSGAAKRGVDVRIVVDGYGGARMQSTMVDTMKAAGCNYQWFRPIKLRAPMRNNHRTHRKLLIVDRAIGFTGGVGIADEWDGDANAPDEWRDTHFRFTGPVVRAIHAGFYDNWIEAADTLPDKSRAILESPLQDVKPGSISGVRTTVISSPSQRFTNTLHTHFLIMFESACESIDLCTAYFMPDESMTEALIDAVRRGVAVRILVPGPHFDKKIVNVAARPLLQELVDAGVELRLYQPSMLHAKVLVIDQGVASIGSANFNRRSTSSDAELNVVMLDRQVAAILEDQFETDWDNGTDLADTHFEDPSIVQQAAEIVLKPFRDLM